MQLICMPFFYCLHDLSSGLEPTFNRAASRSRTLRVRASSSVTGASSLWTSYRSQRLFQSHFSLTLSQLLFQHDPLRWIPKRYAVNLRAVFYCLHNLSSTLKPAFNRAAR